MIMMKLVLRSDRGVHVEVIPAEAVPSVGDHIDVLLDSSAVESYLIDRVSWSFDKDRASVAQVSATLDDEDLVTLIGRHVRLDSMPDSEMLQGPCPRCKGPAGESLQVSPKYAMFLCTRCGMGGDSEAFRIMMSVSE